MKASSRSHLLGVILGIVSIVLGCARVSKEPEKASPASPSNARESHVEESAPSTVMPAAPAPPESVTSDEKAVSAGELRRKRDEERPSPRPSGAASRAERGAGAAAKAAAPPSYSPSVDATPTLAESQELQAAIAEFDASWQQLSASHACDDACRAFESMRRSAQRICDLVVAGDPNQRCRNARGRLDQASRDLAARCSACR